MLTFTNTEQSTNMFTYNGLVTYAYSRNNKHDLVMETQINNEDKR
jgi:hypothetical protein